MVWCIVQETVGNVAIGVQVWVEDAESRWVKGEVIEINNNKVKVGTNNGSEVNTCLQQSQVELKARSDVIFIVQG